MLQFAFAYKAGRRKHTLSSY